MTARALARAAEALAGVPFRLHGRDPATGLDCIGVLAAALLATGRTAPFPTGYALRALRLPDLSGYARACGFEPMSGAVLPGDVLFVRPGPSQFHLLVAVTDGRFVHAHAGLGRVVAERPQTPPEPVSHWRLSED